MISTPPRPDESGESETLDGAGSWEVEGSAGRAAIEPEEVDRASRTFWEAEADSYQAEHGAFLGGRGSLVVDSDDSSDHERSGDPVVASTFVWGPEGLTEEEAGLLGPVDALAGRRVLEVGCGAAQCSRWLADRGVHAVGIDIAVAQLRHAMPRKGTAHAPAPPSRPPGESRRVSADRVPSVPTQSTFGPRSPDAILAEVAGGPVGVGLGTVEVGVASLGVAAGAGRVDVVAATATAMPFLDSTFDVAFASYGAIQFVGDLPRLLNEVRRVLVPGGRWVFSVTHPIRWAFPDDPGPAGLSVSGSYFDRTPYVERDGSGAAVYAEFHRTLGDYVAALVAAGFTIDALVEPEWPYWNDTTWGGWSPLRGTHLPGTLIIGCRADGGAG